MQAGPVSFPFSRRGRSLEDRRALPPLLLVRCSWSPGGKKFLLRRNFFLTSYIASGIIET